MSAEAFYCGVETRAASMYVDPEPAEFCEEEVENQGDLCTRHEEDDRADADYDDYREAQLEDARHGW